MAIVYTTRLNLPKMDIGETGWGVHLNNGMQDADDRLLLSGAGDPDGVETSDYVGQRYWDTTNEVWYTATAAGVSNAWALDSMALKNNQYVLARDQADTVWRSILGMNASDVVLVGDPNEALTLRGDDFANFLALFGAVSRRVIVADASDNNAADLLNGWAGSITVGDFGIATTWAGHLKLPIDVSGDQLILNFGHRLAVGNASVAIDYAQTYNTACYLTGGCLSNGVNTLSATGFQGVRTQPQAGFETLRINVRMANSTGASGAVYWWSLGA